MVTYEQTTKYLDQEWHTPQSLKEYAQEQEAQATRLANRAAAYEFAFDIIKKYPTSSYRLFALIHDLICDGEYLAEDITEVLIAATKKG